MGWSIKKPLGKDPLKKGTFGLISNSQILGTPEQPGPSNPFDNARLDRMLAGVGDTSEYDFLRTSPILSGKGTTASSLYKPSAGSAGGYFDEWLSNIKAPSSVDAVRAEIESQELGEILSQIDRDTAESAGQVRTSALESGWGGAGLSSDIEAVGLGRAYGEGTRAKAGARLGYAQKELDRQQAREKALADALGLRYTTGAQQDIAANEIASRLATADAASMNDLLKSEASLKNARDLGLAGILSDTERTNLQTYADLFNAGEGRTISGRRPRERGVFEDLLRSMAKGGGEDAGKNLPLLFV